MACRSSSCDLILSEVHIEVPHATKASTLATTRFSFPILDDGNGSDDSGPEDDDGDAAVRRPRREFFVIKHQLATPLQQVGRQVWNGACFFVDLLLHLPELVRDKVVLEVGAGVGLASVAAARTAVAVFCTDVEATALQLAALNAAANAHHLRHGAGTIRVRHLNLLQPEPLLRLLPGGGGCERQSGKAGGGSGAGGVAGRGAGEGVTHTGTVRGQGGCQAGEQAGTGANSEHGQPHGAGDCGGSSSSSRRTEGAPAGGDSALAGTQAQAPERAPGAGAGLAKEVPWWAVGEEGEYSWGAGDVDAARRVEVVLAADVVYDDALTRAFVESSPALLARLTAGGGTRPVLLVAEKRYNFTLQDLGVRAPAYDHFVSSLEQQAACYHAAGWSCVTQQMDTASIPQAVAEYDRSQDMELWRVELAPPKHGRGAKNTPARLAVGAS